MSGSNGSRENSVSGSGVQSESSSNVPVMQNSGSCGSRCDVFETSLKSREDHCSNINCAESINSTEGQSDSEQFTENDRGHLVETKMLPVENYSHSNSRN